MKTKKVLLGVAILSLLAVRVSAQQSTQNATEQLVPLSQSAVALDAQGRPALEGTLRTTALHGAPDMPITNIRLVIKNVSAVAYSYISGVVTFYDGSGVRCGEGLVKGDVLAINEALETDTPGIRIRCAPANWRLVATNLLPRIVPSPGFVDATGGPENMIISVDGEEHPIQIDKPMILNLGERQRTIIVRRAP